MELSRAQMGYYIALKNKFAKMLLPPDSFHLDLLLYHQKGTQEDYPTQLSKQLLGCRV